MKGFLKVFLLACLAFSSVFSASLEIGHNIKHNKKIYKLSKNNSLERVSVPMLKFNESLSLGSYIEMPKYSRRHFGGRVNGGLMMRFRF
ncbi:hypothetical protein [Helicobacter cetorum]|uniref:hypothetical protein n=1 Tax=Helicobacter cetorum TaxID=138563 RepID=UPI000CF1BC3F|nr:hypothetical protein [Helicobacter cetorum]